MDLLRRSLAGVFVYAFLLPVIFWPIGFHEIQPQLTYLFAGAMFFFSVLRLIHYVNSKRLYALSPRAWFITFAALSLSQAAILGTVFTLAIFDERFFPIIHVSMLAFAGIASSAVFALSPRIRFGILNLAILMLPAMITGFLSEGYLPLAVMMLVFTVYISGIGIRANKEYRRSFDIEIELEAQRKELETLNQTDALTSIYNRGYFNQHFEDQWQYAMRHELEIAILLIDVDHFKAINDTHGHLAGDACLVNLAYAINKTVNRTIDVAARYGGEEFVVLLSGCNTEQARSMAHKIEQAIQDHKFVHEGTVIPVTVSIGIATTMPKPKQKSSTLIDQADQALYQAKAQGRNRSIVFTEDE